METPAGRRSSSRKDKLDGRTKPGSRWTESGVQLRYTDLQAALQRLGSSPRPSTLFVSRRRSAFVPPESEWSHTHRRRRRWLVIEAHSNDRCPSRETIITADWRPVPGEADSARCCCLDQHRWFRHRRSTLSIAVTATLAVCVADAGQRTHAPSEQEARTMERDSDRATVEHTAWRE